MIGLQCQPLKSGMPSKRIEKMRKENCLYVDNQESFTVRNKTFDKKLS
jgi:hypothetical protein